MRIASAPARRIESTDSVTVLRSSSQPFSAAAFSIWFHLLSQVKVSQLNIWKFLIPLVGAALSWLLIPGEHPDLPTLAGMVLIILGIIHGQRRRTV